MRPLARRRRLRFRSPGRFMCPAARSRSASFAATLRRPARNRRPAVASGSEANGFSSVIAAGEIRDSRCHRRMPSQWSASTGKTPAATPNGSPRRVAGAIDCRRRRNGNTSRAAEPHSRASGASAIRMKARRCRSPATSRMSTTRQPSTRIAFPGPMRAAATASRRWRRSGSTSRTPSACSTSSAMSANGLWTATRRATPGGPRTRVPGPGRAVAS